MKTGGSLIGGRLIDDPRIYRSYALYLIKFVQAYRANGVTVDAITVQNEPQNRTPAGYPGTDMPSAQEEKVIEDLGPMLRAAGLHTQILAYDHNWSEHPNDVATTPPDETADINDYPQKVLNSPAAKWVAGTAYHCYFGDPSAMTALHNQFPDKAIYFTECSGSQSADPANTFSDTLKWHARNLIIGSPRNWAKTVVNWNLALDPSGGPHVGGCGTCTGILTVGPGDTVDPERRVLHARPPRPASCEPGAVRIASTSFGTTGWNGQVMDVAFRNPDGSTALVAHNENDNPQRVRRTRGRPALQLHAARRCAGHVHLARHRPGSYALRQLDPPGWTATANPAGPTDPCCTGDVAATRSTTTRPPATPPAPASSRVSTSRSTSAGRARPPGGLRHRRHPRRLPARLHRHGQLRRVNWSSPRRLGRGHRPADRRQAFGRTGPLRADDAERASGSWWSVADVLAPTPPAPP